MKRRYGVIFYIVLYSFIACSWLLVKSYPAVLAGIIPAVILINIFLGRYRFPENTGKVLRLEYHGVRCLFVFLASSILSAAYHVVLYFTGAGVKTLAVSLVWCIVTLAILFWNGIICVYLSSVQLGIKTRIIGIIFGWVFPVNIVILCIIIGICYKEIWFETEKIILNNSRASEKLCETKYPLLLVHGVFFRDWRLVNYWGRIPAHLIRNGATVFYGQHESASSVKDSGEQLLERIQHIVKKYNCEKVNIIAHSKGGLDCRYAIDNGAAPYVASLTTINTPHRGCEFADYLLDKTSEKFQKKVESAYNSTAFKLGDDDPDFMSAVRDLTAERCRVFDEEHKLPEGIFCQSFGSQLKRAGGGSFPMNFSYHLVKHFDGPNDGLVGEGSFKWGEKYTYLIPEKKKGISHGDMVDQNRKNLPDFDVREFYVNLVHDLKNRGL